MNAVPSCAALAPSRSAAAMPAPSMIPPAAMTGTVELADEQSRQRERAEAIVGGVGIEHAAMPARLVALRDDGIDAGGGERARLGEARRRAEEHDAGVAQRLRCARRRIGRSGSSRPSASRRASTRACRRPRRSSGRSRSARRRRGAEARELGAQALDPRRLARAIGASRARGRRR